MRLMRAAQETNFRLKIYLLLIQVAALITITRITTANRIIPIITQEVVVVDVQMKIMATPETL